MTGTSNQQNEYGAIPLDESSSGTPPIENSGNTVSVHPNNRTTQMGSTRSQTRNREGRTTRSRRRRTRKGSPLEIEPIGNPDYMIGDNNTINYIIRKIDWEKTKKFIDTGVISSLGIIVGVHLFYHGANELMGYCSNQISGVNGIADKMYSISNNIDAILNQDAVLSAKQNLEIAKESYETLFRITPKEITQNNPLYGLGDIVRMSTGKIRDIVEFGQKVEVIESGSRYLNIISSSIKERADLMKGNYDVVRSLIKTGGSALLTYFSFKNLKNLD